MKYPFQMKILSSTNENTAVSVITVLSVQSVTWAVMVTLLLSHFGVCPQSIP